MPPSRLPASGPHPNGHTASRRGKTAPQRRVAYGLLCLLLRPYLRLAYGFTRPKNLPPLPEGPVLMLGNHSSNLDFLYAVCALWPKRFNIVVSSYFFNNARLAGLFRFFRCIRRDQFRADVASIMDMRRVVARGGSVLLYPEGEVNGTGRGEPPAQSVAKLAKLLRVPVYAVRTYGGFFTRPKWNPAIRKGRVEAEAGLVATAEEVASLREEELYARICGAVCVNEYAWQENARVPFPHPAPAEGMENLLYRCPRCGEELCMRAKGAELYCEACGNRGVVDSFGFLSPATPDCVIPRHVPDWVDLEREALRREIAAPDFCLRAEASLQLHLNPRSVLHTDVGKGTVTLDREALRYEGSCQGKQTVLTYPVDSIFKLPFSMGRQFDIPNPERFVSIKPDNGQAVQKFVLALPLLHERGENM
mgnify:CR=1 FL=1